MPRRARLPNEYEKTISRLESDLGMAWWTIIDLMPVIRCSPR